ncbi:uncharacterized protein CPUR_08246 [Claviceps purpurea 20.1]|uniref:Uncharacterized protein n=1 Tax=Claviceps purpurea (strain 20.1) TaxID=1111077 RepID=M1WIE0_CLAP2|nr:uncharacterized protein CPUR_08246 [Claviceps purpurea 20.1]
MPKDDTISPFSASIHDHIIERDSGKTQMLMWGLHL